MKNVNITCDNCGRDLLPPRTSRTLQRTSMSSKDLKQELVEAVENKVDKAARAYYYRQEGGLAEYTAQVRSALSRLESETEKRVVREVREKIAGQIRKRKPTHGTCCTCQVCGGYNDDCDCERNRVLEEVLDLLPEEPTKQ